MKKWTIEYNSGDDSQGFWEDWNVSDGTRSFHCEREEDANWLCELLNGLGAA